ncbi:hypothetical protein PSTAB_2409 [Stutzerimonas stutzeri]|uniref:Uncharacterized protein n=1 Tax=Stutzerimonas stutzeri (strain ATCC 17588 / DSM 5190 / CCUG 11256 / JCM 5965 / LMG 11199 / NBRC 14165 / NCIMB 11358 / Stanier 221) TaxID=96563 RepID=F8H218_STUS2|nr:hypothetical protein PSTAB_2409 [Stutzerimonas stutzeri]
MATDTHLPKNRGARIEKPDDHKHHEHREAKNQPQQRENKIENTDHDGYLPMISQRARSSDAGPLRQCMAAASPIARTSC